VFESPRERHKKRRKIKVSWFYGVFFSLKSYSQVINSVPPWQLQGKYVLLVDVTHRSDLTTCFGWHDTDSLCLLLG